MQRSSETIGTIAAALAKAQAQLGLEGFESAKEFWEHHPLYHNWKFRGWACQISNRAAPEHGKV